MGLDPHFIQSVGSSSGPILLMRFLVLFHIVCNTLVGLRRPGHNCTTPGMVRSGGAQ